MGERYRRLDDLLEMSKILSDSHNGATISDLTNHFDVSRRTLERMLTSLRRSRPDLSFEWKNGTKLWRLPTSPSSSAATSVQTETEHVNANGNGGVRPPDFDVEALQASSTGMVMLDANFRVVWMNDAFARFFSLTHIDVIGFDARDLLANSKEDSMVDAAGFARIALASFNDNSYAENLVCQIPGGPNKGARWVSYSSKPITQGRYAGGRMEHYVDITQLHRSQTWVSHTHRVIAASRQIENRLLELETRQREFLISGQSESMDPYFESRDAMRLEIARLRGFVGDNVTQVDRLCLFESLLEEWHREAAQPQIETRNRIDEVWKQHQQIAELLSQGHGKGILDQLRALLSDLQQRFEAAALHDAKYLALAVTKDIVDMETGERGFLVTGRDEFLEPYHAGLSSFDEHFTALGEQAPSEFSERLARVAELTEQWLNEAARPEIEARRRTLGEFPSVRKVSSLIESETGKPLIKKMRELLLDFVECEHHLLEHRETVFMGRKVPSGSVLADDRARDDRRVDYGLPPSLTPTTAEGLVEGPQFKGD